MPSDVSAHPGGPASRTAAATFGSSTERPEMDPRDCPTGRVATASDDVLDRRPMHQGPAARQRAQPSADSAVVYDLLADGESAFQRILERIETARRSVLIRS